MNNNNTPLTSLRIQADDKKALKDLADLHFGGNLTKLLIQAGLNYNPKGQ